MDEEFFNNDVHKITIHEIYLNNHNPYVYLIDLLMILQNMML